MLVSFGYLFLPLSFRRGARDEVGVRSTTETKKTQRCAFVVLSDYVVRA